MKNDKSNCSYYCVRYARENSTIHIWSSHSLNQVHRQSNNTNIGKFPRRKTAVLVLAEQSTFLRLMGDSKHYNTQNTSN